MMEQQSPLRPPQRRLPPTPQKRSSTAPLILAGFLVLQSLALLLALVIAWPVDPPAPQPVVLLPTQVMVQPAPLPAATPTLPAQILPTPISIPQVVVPPTPIAQPTPTPLPPALKLRGLEITQGIQVLHEPELPQCNPNSNHPNYIFCNNSIPMVAGRHTMVRVYPTCAETCPNTDVVITLHLLQNGQERSQISQILPAATLQRINNLSLLDLRLHLENSVNFEFLPAPDWMIGQVTVAVEAQAAGEMVKPPASVSLTKEFVTRKSLRVAYLPITYQGLKAPEPADIGYWLLRLYPVPGVQYYRLPVPDLAWEGDLNKAEVLRKLLYTYWLYVQSQPAENWPDQLFGWLPQQVYNGGASDPFWCPNCAGVHSSRVAFGGFRPEPDIGGPRILAHEIAHNLGAQHAWSPTQREDAACFKTEGTDISVDPDWPYTQTPHIQEVGIDLYSQPPVIYPPSAYDMMAYCAQPWISPHTYRKIFNSPFLQPDQTALPLASFKPQIETGATGTLLVSGVVYRDGTVAQPEIIQLDGSAFASVPSFTPPPGDDYCLEVQGHDGAILTRRCFAVGFMDLETGLSTAESSPFFFPLLDIDPAAVAKVTITRSQIASPEAPGESLTPAGSNPASSPAPVTAAISSQNLPVITIETPNGGEILSGLQTITWQASDPDGDSLSYDVLYSPNGGQSWLPLAVRLNEPHYTFAAEQLTASQNGLIKVIANDGFNTSWDQSDAPFTIASAPENSLSLQGPTTIQPGQNFEVNLVAHQIAQPGLSGLQFTLHFDPSRVQVAAVNLHPSLNLAAQSVIENERGQLTVVADQPGQVAGLAGDVTLATIAFTATQNEGITLLNLDNVVIGAGDGSPLNVAASSEFSFTVSR